MSNKTSNNLSQTIVLSRDWYGANIEARPEFDIRIIDDNIVFNVLIYKKPYIVSDSNGYTAGLWNADVAELFLCNPSNGYYLELNLAPNGAWWSCAFDNIRNGADEHPNPLENVTTTSHMNESSWSAEIIIQITSLPDNLRFDPQITIGNITFCLKDESEGTRYVSLFDLGPGEPDFHRPSHWKPLFSFLR